MRDGVRGSRSFLAMTMPLHAAAQRCAGCEDEGMKKICVFGAGAVGSHMAAWLAHAGREVSMLARGAALQAMRSEGLRFESAHANFSVRLRVSDDARQLGRQDLVIVALKANAWPGAV